MSLHKLAEVTITVYGLPEHCGTDDELQELTDEATSLLQRIVSQRKLSQVLATDFPGLADKIQITTTGQQQ